MAGLEETIPSEFWSEEKETLLVDLWRKHVNLYDTNLTEFKDRVQKSLTIKHIAGQLNTTEADVERHMKSLRTAFSKARRTPQSGSGRKSITKKTMWILESLQFLIPFIKVRNTTSNLEIQEDVDVNSDPDDNSEDTNDRDNEQNEILSPNESVSAGSSSGEHLVPPKITGTVTRSTSQPLSSIGALTTKKRRKIREDTEIQVLQSIARSIEKSEQERGNAMPSTDPEITSFCSYVEQSMNKMEDNTKAIFRFHVNNLIYQAQCGALTQPQLSYSTTGIGTQNQAGPFNQMLNSWHNV